MPQISYGRHRGPAPVSSHPAAVLMALLPNPSSQSKPFQDQSFQGAWAIPLTLRPANMADHAGQVSFPGGRCQKGESPEQAACREYSEELGCPSERIELIGALPAMYVYASRHQVVPLLGIGCDMPAMRPNPDEVSQVLFLPLEQLMLLHPSVRTIQRGAMLVETLGFWLEGHWVWGATAMMLADLKIRLERISKG
ncbi:MAG: CoA pyrophosphatase [Planctomycetota bacterium]|nr:CoA pyrophosphatase [Planctomycetota bacterium]